MHCQCGTNNRAPRWIFTDPCNSEVRPGYREESASPAWLAAPAMNARDTTKVYICGGLKEQCSRFILNLQKNLDEYFIIYISATAALYFKVLGYLLLTSLMRNYIPKRASGAPIYTLSKLYDVSFGCVTPSSFVAVYCLLSVAEGWLLVDIRLFVLFFHYKSSSALYWYNKLNFIIWFIKNGYCY